MSSGTSGRLPLQVHVGVHPPSHWADLEKTGLPRLRGAAGYAASQLKRKPPELGSSAIDWGSLGVEPRYVGDETADCVAALDPSIFHGSGADELQRFMAGTDKRSETALVVSMIGDVDPPALALDVFTQHGDDNVSLYGTMGSIGGRRLPEGTVPSLASTAVGADRDLGLRVLSAPASHPWWSIALTPTTLAGSFGEPETVWPGGVIEPIVVNSLGETLVGVWLPEDADLRWYVLPAGLEWELAIKWLVASAIPEFVPGALRRSRSGELVDEALLTSAELAANRELARFDEDTVLTRRSLEDEVERARAAAEVVRFGLLYGTGRELVLAVRSVLEAAGYTAVDLDELFDSGASADLLVSRGGRHWLVEVKSASGQAGERLLDDVRRHESTWPLLGRPEKLAGSAIVVNHQHALPPLDRATTPYTRAEFIRSLEHPVLPATALFGWWRDSDWSSVRAAVEGPAKCYSLDLSARASPPSPQRDTRASAVDSSGEDSRARRGLFGRGR